MREVILGTLAWLVYFALVVVMAVVPVVLIALAFTLAYLLLFA